jgi:hypothetical protein
MFFSIHAMKAYKGRRGTAPVIVIHVKLDVVGAQNPCLAAVTPGNNLGTH